VVCKPKNGNYGLVSFKSDGTLIFANSFQAGPFPTLPLGLPSMAGKDFGLARAKERASLPRNCHPIKFRKTLIEWCGLDAGRFQEE
jgi:hypothetical protein